ncbi:MAG TPA: hypothetical protein VM141_01180 [Planctomycetota bacterium]|nr:hypothetical protein [Planctomycetota bacterium]
MGTRKAILGAVLVGIVLSLSTAIAGERRGARGGEAQRMDPEQMRQRMSERLKETLKVSDEDWKVLGPMVEKVQALARDLSGAGARMLLGRRGGEAQPQPENAPEQSPVILAAQALQTLLENEAATVNEIKAKLTAYREAREKAKEEVDKAKAALLEAVTPRQEAQLVLMGVLE